MTLDAANHSSDTTIEMELELAKLDKANMSDNYTLHDETPKPRQIAHADDAKQSQSHPDLHKSNTLKSEDGIIHSKSTGKIRPKSPLQIFETFRRDSGNKKKEKRKKKKTISLFTSTRQNSELRDIV